MRALALLLCLSAPTGAAQGADHLIGRPYAGLPGGWGALGGTMLQTPGDSTEYSMSLFRRVHRGETTAENDAWLMLYKRLEYRLNGRHPVWTVMAALRIEPRRGETVVWPECLPVRTIVVVAGALGDTDENGLAEWGPVRLAWELDREAGAFRPLDAAEIVCEPVRMEAY